MNWKMIFKTTIIIGVLAEIICGLTDPRAKIDWHKVVPVQDLPGFWKDKDIRFTPISFDKRERVVGGDFADPGQFPFQVALVLDFQGEFVFCGGCVISDTVILTAAHCLVEADSAVVILGAFNYTQEEDGQTVMWVTKENFKIHRYYNPRMFEQDVATIICPRFVFTPLIQPIPLTTDKENLFVGEMATVSGFGRYTDDHLNKSDVIRFASMEIITNEECERTFGAMIKSQLCCSGEEGRSACNGDSGGPLTVLYDGVQVLAGVVSFGSSKGCEVNKPSAYSRVSHFASWIYQNMEL